MSGKVLSLQTPAGAAGGSNCSLRHVSTSAFQAELVLAVLKEEK